MTNILVPTLGESVTEATVATWFKKPGDYVNVDEMLCELETDKVTVEVPSTAEGVLRDILAPEGTTVNINAILASIEESADTKIRPENKDKSEYKDDPGHAVAEWFLSEHDAWEAWVTEEAKENIHHHLEHDH